MEAIRQYFRESYNELVNKVTWPSISELQSTTVIVLVASLIIALVVYLMDLVSNLLLQNTVY